MKIKRAPIALKAFYILESKCRFIQPEEEAISVPNLFNDYGIDFDFSVRQKNSRKDFDIFTKIGINLSENSPSLPGYQIFSEAVSIFEFVDIENIDDELIDNYIYITGLSIAINNLRSYIMNKTGYFPFGKYQLPAIDLAALHKDKAEKMESRKNSPSD